MMITNAQRQVLGTLAIVTSLGIATVVSAEPADDAEQIAIPAPPVIDYVNNDPWEHPVRPPVCNDAQLEMGDVRACVVRTYGRPFDNGWATPPAPNSGEASEWLWNGYSYRGSPALAEWEAEQITSNEQRIGKVYAGDFESHVGIAAIFENFLIEITARGYELRDAHGYDFRCTNATGGWSCPNGSVNDLSFHAWGLALDMNADANPIKVYQDPSGGNACEVAMETDMPQWLIQTAEKWGLYWGGYGWGDGCASPSTSAYRDPPHFEFRGTPEMAEQILRFNLRNDPDLGCYDVVDLDGTERMICNREFVVEAGWRVAIDPDAPAGATAAIVNLTATTASEDGFFSLESCAARATAYPETSNVNFVEGQDVANLAVIPLDADGRFCLFHSVEAHGVIDVLAFLTSSTDVTTYGVAPQAPRRIVDTRSQPSCDTSSECEIRPVDDQEAIVIEAAPDEPYLANLTVTRSSAPGFISAGGCSQVVDGGGVPTWSNLNYRVDEDRANLAIIRPDSNLASCAFSWGGTDLIVDVLGTLSSTDPSGLAWTLTPPERILDTRRCDDPPCTFGIDNDEVLRIPVDSDAPFVAVNVTATDALEWGFVTIDACSTLDALTGSPSTSTVNIDSGATAANLTLAAVENGEICAWSYGKTHLIVDVQAELNIDGNLRIDLDEPLRIYDGRKGGTGLITQ